MREWQSLLQVLHVYADCSTELIQSFLWAHLSVAACVSLSSPVHMATVSRPYAWPTPWPIGLCHGLPHVLLIHGILFMADKPENVSLTFCSHISLYLGTGYSFSSPEAALPLVSPLAGPIF